MAGPATQAITGTPSYTHEAMMDLILATPMISQGEIARHFGYSEGWVSQVIRADNFQARLAERKSELIDPAIIAQLEERLTALAHRSVDVLMEQLDLKQNPEIALKALELTTRAKGYGAAASLHLTQNFVVAMPQKSADAVSWAEEHKPRARLIEGALTLDTVIE